MAEKLTFRRYTDDDHTYSRWSEDIFTEDTSYKCPTYVHRTPPCQGSCPSGEDIRGWLQIVRGIEKPPADIPWQEYAFRRSTDANPFPSIMGRVCPAPCQEGCNRNPSTARHRKPAEKSPSSAVAWPAWQPPTNCAGWAMAPPSSTNARNWAAWRAMASRVTACHAT
jgi:hypothetical protein